ncbi:MULTISPECIES: hypothetical protein [unclassified Cupriavidus]|uniref:hypothetical protein n=1 Tax=unclassified Cupriavidus TaxID=2640874 RepID=UPI0010551F54|nr:MULTISPECIES: hypothetical protein [unclassified Cupriavidus]MBF6991985.1 hypothetical protein [Cupriavidus sp. IK-TO18]TDF67560.1 hypothetical protein E1J61_04715 [Cupriavidus sp. L7L]
MALTICQIRCSAPSTTADKQLPPPATLLSHADFADLAGYEVPVHADIPHQEVIFLDETDPMSSPMKETTG